MSKAAAKPQWRHVQTVKVQPIAKRTKLYLVREEKKCRGGHLCRLSVLVSGPISTRVQARKVAAQIEALLVSEDP